MLDLMNSQGDTKDGFAIFATVRNVPILLKNSFFQVFEKVKPLGKIFL